MCGIAGIISSNTNNITITVLKQMTDSIRHRGPDGEGHWINSENTVGFGHRRLSIIDLSNNADQPMHYLNRYTITFNGEIYNYVELKTELQKKGYVFHTNSDTEVLIALYDLKKEKCLDDIDGMFAFALYDNDEKITFCARDRFGEKPFYYHINNNTFYFASEMKALWASGINKEPNLRKVFLYLAYNAQEDTKNLNYTFYNNIINLEAAHYLIVKNGKIIKIKRYWDICISQNAEISFEEAKEKILFLFKQSISRRLRADVPIGSCLSGGIDSSSIVATINQLKNKDQTQKVFSARFKDFKNDEGEYIKRVVDKFKLNSHEIYLTPELINEQINKVFYYQEEPFGSKSIIAQYFVMKLAKENNVTVLLDGQGADEYFAGYHNYFINLFRSLILSNKNEYKVQISHYNNLYNTKFNIESNFKLYAKFPELKNNLRNYKNIILKANYLKQFNKDFLNEFHQFEYPHIQNNNLSEELKLTLTRVGLNNLLRYADRNSMAHGREVRLPFLYHQLVEFVFTLPDNYKLYNAWTKYILRDTMKEILPEQIVWRKEKIGFEPPFPKTVDKDLVENSINILSKNKIINPNALLKNNNWEYLQASKLFET
jgi:asparagine synthase (glutamine-hydrolysing)